jgi:inhibitor of cysteine peptidase
MRKIYYICFIGILLSLAAISPVIAISPVTTLHSNYFYSATLLKPGQNRFAGSADMFTLVKPATTYSRFASYTQMSTGNTQTFTERDSGKTVTVTKGQVLKIQLNENPTTGYRWEPSLSSGMQVMDDTYAASTSGRMGAGGIHTWTLRITGPGTQHFDASYKRSWESGSEDTFSMQFVVV